MELADGDVVNGACAKFSVKLLRSQPTEVMYVVRPEVKDVVSTESENSETPSRHEEWKI